jgi:uncharacterized alpha-E superfamily protein
VIETAAIMPFLPGLSKHLLGEPLKLPSVATWWCGQEYALNWVLDHLDHVVVKPAFPSREMEPVFGAALASAAKQKFAEQLRSRPHEFVAQEQVALSSAPVWDGGNLFSRSLVLRTYVLNTGTEWTALPGGLVRVAGEESSVVSMQRGGHSKDTWILWDSPVETFSLLRPRNEPVELRRGTVDLPSRVSDNLFWLGRYVERAENTARLLRTLFSRVRRADPAELRCLVRLHGCLESRHSKIAKKRRVTADDLEQELVSAMMDLERPDSLTSTLAEVLRVGGNARERLSADMTRLISELAQSATVEGHVLFVEYSAVLTGCLELLSAFSGMERENVTRGPGWLFMSLGRRLERAISSARHLRDVTTQITAQDYPLLEYLLEAADSSMTYRSRYFTTLQPVAMLDVLMADETNPRSLDFQISHLVDLYGKLPNHNLDDLSAIQDALRQLRAFDLQALDYPLPGEDSSQCASVECARLAAFLKQLEAWLPSWSNNLSNKYFSHARTLPTTIGS